MYSFDNKELEKIIIEESLIKSISWCNGFKDVVMDIDWCGQDDLNQKIDFNQIKTSLYFEFVTDTKFDFEFKINTMGALEITSFLFEQSDNVWLVEFRFDFYPVGNIKFKCNNLRFIIVPLNE